MAPTAPDPARSLAAPTAEPITLGYVVRGYAATTVFCLIIGVVLWALQITPLYNSLVVSFSIGWSVHSMSLLGRRRLEPRVGPRVSALLLTSVGLSVGLVLSGLLLYGRPLLFFIEAPGTLLLGAVLGIAGYTIFGTRARLLTAQLEVERLERTQAEQARQLAQAELKILQAQIEPHFLFNTLSNVQSLLHDEPDKADRMLEQLTVLLRQSLSRTRRETTSLGEELALIRAYLDIQQIRMGDRLSFEIDVDPQLDAMTLPPLLLQPLVENAITHGIEAQPGPGHLTLSGRRTASGAQLQVTDTGPGLTAAAGPARPGHGTGLANIRERLGSRYGTGAQLTLSEAPAGGLVATLNLPLEDPSPDRAA